MASYFFCAVFLALLVSCSPTKKLLPNQYIVDRVEVLNTRETNLPKENFEAFFRQKPNRKFLRKIDFFVWWYNLFDNEKINRKKEIRNQKYDVINAGRVKRMELKNERRAKKGKKARKAKLKDKESLLLIESVRDIGEPAVILDSSLTEQTRFQLSKYLFGKGFFNNEVKDTIVLIKNTRRAIVKYALFPKQPYVITQINYQFDDAGIGSLILHDTTHCLLKRGDVYDFEKQLAEKQRITDLASNNGYFYYENAYTSFLVDSILGNHHVSVNIHGKKYAKAYSSSNDSLVYTNHPKLKLQNVYVITEAVIGKLSDARFKDTLHSSREGLTFLLNKPLAYREAIFLNNIDLYKGQLFRRDTAQLTYKQLLNLGIFKNVNIQFLANSDYRDRLDCYIICNPLIKQSLTAETEGTNTSGNLGIDGSIVYQNRNLFKGGEFIEFKMQGALVAQSQFNQQEDNNSTLSQLQRHFNTFQIGPELTFAVPRAFFPFSLLPFRKEMSPRTYIKTSINFQSRPEFSRIITSIDYGFSFKTNGNRFKHDIIPFEAYFVNANLTNTFKNQLSSFNDAFLLNSFQNHITTLSKYALTYVTKENSNTSAKAVYYLRWSISSSGNILRTLFDAIGHKKDSLNRYLIFNIPFAQFIRSDLDYRIYIPIHKKSRMVYRLAGGIGKPLKNLSGLPYEQSFFSGGPNSIRAWRARTLGPGGYDPSNSSTRYDKIGDILLEANAEYRFHIIKSFNGALFVDAGNIWRLNPDPAKPRGEFVLSQFADQIAIGGGLGIRWDLNFFVLRLDLAAPLKDPKFEQGNRWTFDKRPWDYAVANFGIGYPF
ncbi:MAG: BamA/TamA family outer membrane protein [Bacteroidia bacterium]|nr:BamA/TamA family outer membrane protein [Bacteroidia bacterium]